MVLKLNYHRPYPPLEKSPHILLVDFPFKLPKTYIDLLKSHDGGFLDYEFKYYDKSFCKKMVGGIGVLYGLSNKYNIQDRYNSEPDFFPKNLVAFADAGNGDLTCFDYRKDIETNNPPIVYWIHDAEEDKEICPLAKDFEAFLSILKEQDEASCGEEN